MGIQGDITTAKEVETLEFEELGSENEPEKPALGDGKYLDVVKDVQIKLSAVLGETKITVGDLFGLKDGGILPLDKLTTEPLELYLSGQLVAKGNLIIVDDNFGVQLTEICDL